MKKSCFIIFLFLISAGIFGQSLPSTRSDIYNLYVPKYGTPEKIEENNTFYGNQLDIKKKIIVFSENLDTIKETRYKNGELDAELLFVFNINHQLIYRSFKNIVPKVGWQYKQSIYLYDQNCIKEIKTTDAKGNLKFLAKIKCDEIGNPMELELYDSNLNLIGYETGEYNYDKNKWTYRVFKSNGNLVSEKEFNIEGEMPPETKYNEKGDNIFYPRNWHQNDNVYYQKEYKYDDFGNWIEIKFYKLELINGKLKNKQKDKTFKREIKYKN